MRWISMANSEDYELKLKQYLAELERYKCELEKWKTDTQCSMIMYQQVNMQGQAAMKAALLINGGASVAMLAFIGTAMNRGTDNILLLKLCFSMLMFIAGVLSVAFAMGVAYLAGFADASETDTDQSDKKTFKWWSILNTVAIILTVIGYIWFITGSLNAYCAFTNWLS
jgi:hypothetical protein